MKQRPAYFTQDFNKTEREQILHTGNEGATSNAVTGLPVFSWLGVILAVLRVQIPLFVDEEWAYSWDALGVVVVVVPSASPSQNPSQLEHLS